MNQASSGTKPQAEDAPKIAARRKPPWDWLAVAALTTLWSLGVGWLAVQRHLAFQTEFDVAVYSHVIWTTTQGHPFFNSLVAGVTNYLGHHFVPLMLVYVPLYSVWPDPRMLIVAQTVVLAVGALPLYAFARRHLRNMTLALLVIAAYLLSPLLYYVAFADLHEIALAVPLLIAAGAALLDKRTRATMIWLGLALLTKEEVVVIALGFGLYALLIQRRWRSGVGILAGSALWGVLLFRVLMPAFAGGEEGIGFLWRYAALGNTPAEILRTFMTRPAVVLGLVAARPKLVFIWQLLAPLGGLPLFGWPAVLLVLPPLAYLLLSNYAFQATIWYHYTAPLIPFLFLATIVGLQWFAARGRHVAALGGVLLISATLLAVWRWSPLPGSRLYRAAEFRITDEARALRALVATIPPAAAVAADPYVQPWLANRWRLGELDVLPFQQFPGEEVPDYLVIHEPGPNAADPPLYPWLVADKGANPLRIPRFQRIAVTPGGMALFKRRPPEDDVRLTRYDAAFERGLTLIAAGLPPEAPSWGQTIRVSPGITLPVWMAWSAAKPPRGSTGTLPDPRITFSLHLLDEADRLVAQADGEMGAGRFPTTLWHTWLDHPVVADEFSLVLPADLPAGRYRLLAGAYESETVTPLARRDSPETAPGLRSQWVPLGILDVRR